MARSKPTITYKKKDEIAVISMNRPEYNNAQNGKMTYDLDKAFKRAIDDDGIKVIVLKGNGKHFSAGHDLGTPEEKEDAAAAALCRVDGLRVRTAGHVQGRVRRQGHKGGPEGAGRARRPPQGPRVHLCERVQVLSCAKTDVSGRVPRSADPVKRSNPGPCSLAASAHAGDPHTCPGRRPTT